MRHLKMLVVLGLSTLALTGCVLQSVLTGFLFLGVPSPDIGAEPVAMASLDSRFDGLPQTLTEEGFPQLGYSDAPVTVSLYSSFTCPHCAEFNEEQLPVLLNYVVNGDVQIIYYTAEFPQPELARSVSETAVCAAEQGVFWALHDILFRNTREMGATDAYTDARIDDYLAEVGVDNDLLNECLESGRGLAVIDAATANARSNEVSGVPAVSVNGAPPFNPSATSLQTAIDEALASS